MTDDEIDKTIKLYEQAFGPAPYIGLTDDQIQELAKQMLLALDGKRAGDISEEEFFGDFGTETTI